jgi:hypothetical protein
VQPRFLKDAGQVRKLDGADRRKTKKLGEIPPTVALVGAKPNSQEVCDNEQRKSTGKAKSAAR